MSATLVLAGIVLCALSGVPSLFGRRAMLATFPILLLGSIAGLAGCALALTGAPAEMNYLWSIPGGAFHIRLDALSAFFAAPVFLIAAAGSLYGERYWPRTRDRAAYVRVFFGVMAAALVLVMTAANTILFAVAWELVAGSSYFLVATEHEDDGVRRAGWIYLAASHVATLALFALVALLHSLTATWSFTALPAGSELLPAGRAIFVLALVAFGTKAGIMPFHVWLPGAHAGGPSHVSAMMSGVVIKMGVYGLVRVLSLYGVVPPSFGVVLLIAGIISSVLGVAFALAQHDLKRLLAYHSIENIGIIITGLGIGVIAQSHGMTALAILGYAGALLHVWNHGLFKALLFLSGGAAIHSVHTREIDRMGGIGKLMPWTAGAFLLGAVAITGLPPLNGFASEWLLYVASFRSVLLKGESSPAMLMILVAPALALTGALALACFVKAFGAVFLGSARTPEAAAAHESPLAMRAAMLPLAIGCIAIGLLPAMVAPLLERAVSDAAPHLAQSRNLAALFHPIQFAAIVVAAILLLAIAAMVAMTRNARRALTWDCGYVAPSARMQYTSSSFARGLVGFFAWAMPPEVHAPKPFALFPKDARFESHVPDTVLDRALLPLLRAGERAASLARFIQGGRVQLYLLYVVATLVVLLAWSAL